MEVSSLVVRSIGTEGEVWGLSEESAATGLWQAGHSETYTDSPCHSPAHPSLKHVSASADGGWVLEPGVWRANLGRGLLLAARRRPEGMGVRKSATRNACGGNLDCHRNKAPLLSDTQGARLPLQPLSLCTGPASLDTGRDPHWGWLSCTCNLWLPYTTCHHQGWLSHACGQAQGRAPAGADCLLPGAPSSHVHPLLPRIPLPHPRCHLHTPSSPG